MSNKTKASRLPEGYYIRTADLVPHIIPVSRSTLWRMVRQGRFPKPVKISQNKVLWRVADVKNWIDSGKVVAG